jgi:hypothetical protein
MSDRPRLHTLARRDVAWCITALVAAQLVLAVALERWRPELRDPEYGHKLRLVRRQTAAAGGRPLLVSLGSSRVLNGLRPALLPAGDEIVFNFGMTGLGPVQQMLALNRLLHDGVRPRWVTIEVVPQFLSAGAAELSPTIAGRHTLRDVRLGERCGAPVSYAAGWLEARSAPWYANRFVLLSKVWPAWVPADRRADYVWTNTDPSGWLALPDPPGGTPSADVRARTEALAGDMLRHLTVAPASERALRDTLARCRDAGIGAAVVLMPEASWFRDLLPRDNDRMVRSMASALGRDFNVPVVDAREWCPDGEFSDGQHLLPRGGARFTERFGREVLPWLTHR